MSFKPSPDVPPLTRPQLAEARRVRAAELFGQGRANAEIARMLGVSDESVRRWKRAWEKGGTDALRRRPATGRPPKLDDAQAERVRRALEQGRPQLAEARRVRAAELFGQGRANAEIARMLGVSDESVRRWKRAWEKGGTDALRRRPATGRPPKLDDAQAERVRRALEQGAQAHGFEADLWTLERVGLGIVQ
ncbi:helix-turn-helix domain-containing protein, partial [Streptomyces sp. PU-14G]|uniref:helix-turn-helix domain-containing protein n=1 Tax=Streptomyces sp. PU-14G TaxID=2800808 RepID=UPI0034DFA2DE